MGNHPSISMSFQEIFPHLSHAFDQQSHGNSFVTEQIKNMTYDDLIKILKELNSLSEKCMRNEAKGLVFAVKKGTDSTLLWKATLRIACVTVVPGTQEVESYRLLSLEQFLRVFNTIKLQYSAIKQDMSADVGPATTLPILQGIDDVLSDSDAQNCIICFERLPQVSLPCAHSFCTHCIEEWGESHGTCPVCREKIEDTDESWILSEIPRVDEISTEIKSELISLASR